MPLECAPRHTLSAWDNEEQKKVCCLLAINLQFDSCFIPEITSKLFENVGIGMRWKKEVQQTIFLIFNPKISSTGMTMLSQLSLERLFVNMKVSNLRVFVYTQMHTHV